MEDTDRVQSRRLVQVLKLRVSIEIPVRGEWSLSYWFPTNLHITQRLGTTYNFVLRHVQQETAIQAGIPDFGGWMNVGEFNISDSVVELDHVSVEPRNSVRLADAIQWTLTEEYTE